VRWRGPARGGLAVGVPPRAGALPRYAGTPRVAAGTWRASDWIDGAGAGLGGGRGAVRVRRGGVRRLGDDAAPPGDVLTPAFLVRSPQLRRGGRAAWSWVGGHPPGCGA